MKFFLNPNFLISSHLSKHAIFSLEQVLKPFTVNFFNYEILRIFGCQKCVSASEKHVLFKMKFFKCLNFFFNLKDLMSSFPSKDDNCTARNLLKTFRTHFQEFQFSTFSTSHNCTL